MTLGTWFKENLVCPRDHQGLECRGEMLVCASDHRYPVVEGVPIMLIDDVEQTIGVATASLHRAQGKEAPDRRAAQLHLESLGISEAEKQGILQLQANGQGEIDPVVAYLIGATSGYSYKHLIGRLPTYPIPELRLADVRGEAFLDIGCNWGRWSIAAARKGYAVVGIDPSLGAILAARRVAAQLGLPIRYLVADGRYLPFKPASFSTIFAYSVLQHLAPADVGLVIAEVARVLREGGTSFIQMAHFLGIRSLYHQARRRFRQAQDFEVRYWSMPQLKRAFGRIGRTSLSVDCYFGLGLQTADRALMPNGLKLVIDTSEVLRKLSNVFSPLKYLADSLYVMSVKAISSL